MEIAYKFTPKEINKLSKFKNPSIVLKKDNIIKNGKYKIYLTKNMFNRLLEKGELKYTFTDKRKEYYIQQGGSISTIFESLSPHLIEFGKRLMPALGIATASTLTSHGISKALNKKRGGSILKIDLIFEYAFNSEVIDIPLVINLKIDGILEKDFNINLKRYNKIIHMFKLDYNVTKIKFILYLLNNKKYNNEKMEYLKKILFNNRKIKFNIFSYNI